MLKPPPLKRRIGVSDDPGALKPSLAQCLEAVLDQADGLIDDVLTGLDIALAKSRTAPGRGDPSPHTTLAIELLVRQRAAVRKTFVAQLRAAVFQGGGPDANFGKNMMSFESLQLLEEEQLDENIEVARALQEISISVDEALPPLDALMSTLLGWITIQAQINPLRPQLFVRALRETIAAHVGDVDARGAIIGPASGRMGVGLQKLYKEITDWLRSYGVEPAGITSAAVAPGAVTKVGAAQSSVAKTLLTLDRLRKLLAGELDDNGNLVPRNPQDFLHTVPASLESLQDLKQVDAMVQRLTRKARSSGDDTVVRKPRKVAQTSKQLGKELGEEVARMMLDNLVEDERLLPRVRDLLQALEPVLLPLTKTDARFFSDRLHPARQFLDRVTHRSLGYTTEQDEGFPKFLKSVEDAIVALTENAGAGGDMAPFGLALQRLEEIWTREDKAQRKRREEAAKALLHAEQRNMLAQRLSQEFRDKAQGKEVPQLVVDFLGGAWAQAVAELQLTHPDGTPDPYGFLNLVDELIWSVQPSVARRNRTRLVEMVPRMLGQLRQGLHLIDYPAERISLLFDELIALHEKALEGIRIKAPTVELPMPGLSGAEAERQIEPEEVADSEFWLAGHEADESGYLPEEAIMPMDLGARPEGGDAPKTPTSVGELNTGAWIELMLDGNWIRAQLTWASPHRTLFMFTSRGGLAHSMSRRTMERLRGQGMIKIVSDGHVVDNALDAVAQTALRNTLDKNG
ncbi:MAG: DUF1631 family protein [Comamonadaceae bacterium]|nr:MAG: DUF1631 family protein [Comamonadaceae bacterium]